MIFITVTSSKRAGLDLEGGEVSSEELTEQLSTYDVREDKDGPAIIPARFKPCPEGRCRNSGKPGAIDCGGGKFHRLAANVVEMTAIGVDVDDVTEARAADILDRLRSLTLEFHVWQTHGHDPEAVARGEAKCRFRILIPFHKAMPLVSAKQWSQGAWPALIRYLGLEGVAAADVACKDASRVYFLPSKPTEDMPREAAHFEGNPLDWEAVLGNALEGFAKAAQVEVRAPNTDPTRVVDLEPLKADLRDVARRTHSTSLQRLLSGEALTPPPDKRAQGDRSRYTCWRGVTQSVANKAAEWMVSEALLELFRPSWDQEVRESPDDFTAWETIENLFESARAEAVRGKAEREAKWQADRAMVLSAARQMNAGKRREAPAEGSPVIPSLEADAEQMEDPDAWLEDTSQFVWKTVGKGEDARQVMASDKRNLAIVIANDSELQNVRYNEMSLSVEVQGDVFEAPEPTPFRDTHATAVAHRVLARHEMNFDSSTVREYLFLAAERRKYDPLKDYLNGLEWDGIPRLHRLFVDYIKCRVPEEGGVEYLETISKRWLVSGVARGLEPGCKVDTVLHMKGDQGVKKSTALNILGGRFFADTALNFEDKDAAMLCSRSWFIELAEGVSLSKASRELRKSFISRRVDTFRAPYARSIGDFPRRCLLASNTNQDTFLDDPSGNRRDWVVEVLSVETELLKADRDQLMAEAVTLFKAGFQWYLTTEEAEIAESIAEQHTDSDSLEEKIVAWYLSRPKDGRPDKVNAHQIATRILGEDTRVSAKQMASSLKRAGFTRMGKVIEEGIRQRYWLAPKSLLSAPQRADIYETASQARIQGAVEKAKA